MPVAGGRKRGILVSIPEDFRPEGLLPFTPLVKKGHILTSVTRTEIQGLPFIIGQLAIAPSPATTGGIPLEIVANGVYVAAGDAVPLKGSNSVQFVPVLMTGDELKLSDITDPDIKAAWLAAMSGVSSGCGIYLSRTDYGLPAPGMPQEGLDDDDTVAVFRVATAATLCDPVEGVGEPVFRIGSDIPDVELIGGENSSALVRFNGARYVGINQNNTLVRRPVAPPTPEEPPAPAPANPSPPVGDAVGRITGSSVPPTEPPAAPAPAPAPPSGGNG
jgi:hypothetical protein